MAQLSHALARITVTLFDPDPAVTVGAQITLVVPAKFVNALPGHSSPLVLDDGRATTVRFVARGEKAGNGFLCTFVVESPPEIAKQ